MFLFRVLSFNNEFSISSKKNFKKNWSFYFILVFLMKCYFETFFLLSFTYKRNDFAKFEKINVETFIKISLNRFHVFKQFFVRWIIFCFSIFVSIFDFEFNTISFVYLIFEIFLLKLFLKLQILKFKKDFSMFAYQNTIFL